MAAAVGGVQSCSLIVVASPTYKATYTGLLKLFLDRIGSGALSGVTAVPLMLGGDMRHSLAPEVFLKPVLVDLVVAGAVLMLDAAVQPTAGPLQEHGAVLGASPLKTAEAVAGTGAQLAAGSALVRGQNADPQPGDLGQQGPCTCVLATQTSTMAGSRIRR